MIEQSPNVIAIGFAKRALEEGSRERKRMREYATVLGSYHLVVFTRANEEFPKVQQTGNLFLYATNARTKVGMVWSAYQIGRKIMRSNKEKHWVVTGQDPFWAGLVACALTFLQKNASLHLQIHGDVFNPYFFNNDFLAGLKTRLAKKLVQRAKKIRVVSGRIKASLLRFGISEAKITVLPIQGDLESFLTVGETRQYVSPDITTFLYVGRLAPEKNLPLLLKAFAGLVQAGNSARLQILGAGPLKKQLLDQCQRLKITQAVQFLPWTNNVAEVMAQADVLCLSSLHEGFALVLVEAMSAGLPVITTDVGCAGEVVKDQVHGYVVPVLNTEAYQAALTKLCVDPSLCAQMGKAGHSTVKESKLSAEAYLHAIKESFTI